MKRIGILLWVLSLGLAGCSQTQVPTIQNTFQATPAECIEEYGDGFQEVTLTTYYEMSDGTWKTDDHAYRYRLEITGRLYHAERDTTYVILSNTEDISFEQAWKASGLSSNLEDYFQEDEAVFVAIR